jgi:hypothetical protein
LYDSLSWQLVVFAVAGGLSQQAHRFAHSPTVRLPPVIRILERAHVLQEFWNALMSCKTAGTTSSTTSGHMTAIIAH